VRTEFRFLLAIGLMVLVMIGTNILYPPIPPEPPVGATSDSLATSSRPTLPTLPPPSTAPGDSAAAGAPAEPAAPPDRTVVVESPLYRYVFSTRGAVVRSVELPTYQSMHADGPVRMIPDGTAALGQRIVVGSDTVNLEGQPFEVSPPEGLSMVEGGEPQTITFTYQHPTDPLALDLSYTFDPDSYVVDAHGQVRGAERPLVITSLGNGLGFNEADSAAEAGTMAYVRNHVNEGVFADALSEVDQPRLEEGPFLWAAFRSKYFLFALLSRGDDPTQYLGGLFVEPQVVRERTSVAVAQSVAGGEFAYRLLIGPQDFAELTALGNDLEDVNPYGWRFFRPIIRPFVGIITFVLTFLHNSLNWGYGWVLILFGLMMRIVLWPFNQKAMRAQMRNMAVQPMLKEIQVKYKDNPEKLQKEMLRLYKEYGFNPMAGCLPMLLPWPILIALFFVFQNTIEFRGVPFLWLPDLSAKDPLYILPIFLAVSMFALQYMSFRAMDQQNNPQMKMMLWFFPLFFGFLFMQFAAGLNLYYSVSNVATLPQQWWIMKERKKAAGKPPVKIEEKRR
jgi:YidC/Oxa1 family membrane protein insertase